MHLYSFGILVWVLLSGGVKNCAEPQPPMGQRRGMGNYGDFKKDWRCIRQCLDYPQRFSAQPVANEAKAMVRALVERKKQSRPNHGRLRELELIAQLGLPEFGTGRDAVEHWLQA